MATKQTRLIRGRRRGRELVARTLAELVSSREFPGLSQRAVADAVGWSQPHMWRFEANTVKVSVVALSEVASLLGLELSVGLHELGDPVRDKGQRARAAV